MKVIVAGSRDGFVAKNVFEAIELSEFNVTEVVSGTARGVDQDGEYFAKVNKLPVKRFPAQWKDREGNLDRGAGIKRNLEMAKYADALVAVWDGRSPGTKNMIETMKNLDKPVYVYIR